MRRVTALAALVGGGLSFGVGLLAGPQGQPPASQGQPPDPQAVFRTGVDLIRRDVSVLDKSRRPVRGLTAEDFSVFENGKPQRIVAVSEMNAADQDPKPSAWIRHSSRDIAGNDLADQLEGGRAIAIVLDEGNLPIDSSMQVATRDLARHIIDSLGQSDLAAVIFPLNPGKNEDFTHDRQRLYDAIDKFKAEQRGFEDYNPPFASREGDVYRYSSVLSWDPCLRAQPAVPMLRTVTGRLATIPNQRKSVFFISVGVPVQFSGGRTRCQSLLYEEMRATFREAQRGNVNIHAIDPGGAKAFQDMLQDSRVINGRMSEAADSFSAHMQVQVRHDFLETFADQTGGRIVANSDTVIEDVDRIFAEDLSYYLIGYETSNGDPDGKFRRVEVKVNGRDVTVHSSSGYWGADKDRPIANERRDAPSSNAMNMTGLTAAQGLVLRAAVHPMARVNAAARRNDMEIAAVVTVRVPAPRQAVPETLTLTRTIADSAGRTTQPYQETRTLMLEPLAGDSLRYDVWSRFSLPPGHYEVRFNAASRAADASGSVYAEVDVPDLSRPGVSMSAVALGTEPGDPRLDPFGSFLPIVPTTAREFTSTDRVSAFLRVFQGGTVPVVPAEMQIRIVGSDDTEEIRSTEKIAPETFDAGRSAVFRTAVPLERLKPGMYLLSLTATLEGGRSTRRDVVFKVK